MTALGLIAFAVTPEPAMLLAKLTVRLTTPAFVALYAAVVGPGIVAVVPAS